MENTRIFATYDKSFDIGTRVIKWDEPNGYDFHKFGNFTKRNISYTELQKVIQNVCIHWAVTYRCDQMYDVLKNRNLSVNFMIDDDMNENGRATIYQCLPIMHAGWSQGKRDGKSLSTLGPGIELSYRPEHFQYKTLYSAENQKKWDVKPHEVITAPIHGTKLSVHLPTKAQMKALEHLLWGFSELFPDVPAAFPRDSKGEILSTDLADPFSYSGYVHHYHLRRDKIDAAGIDNEELEKAVKARLTFGY